MRSGARAVSVLIGLSQALAATASAYPTGVVFTPTGETMTGGTVCAFAYASSNLSPAVSPGATWIGVQVGLLPQFEYGNGPRFGGLEIGFDTISPYGNGIVKPVLNAKLGFVTEGKLSPSVSAGIMEISPALPSMNFIYVSATKTLQFAAGPAFGRLTVGFGGIAGSREQLNGTFPFKDTRFALMLAYESPLIARRLGFAIDYFGGTSELSSTYIGATLVITDSTRITAGGYLSNERSNPTTTSDGFFASLTVTFDALTLFKPAGQPLQRHLTM